MAEDDELTIIDLDGKDVPPPAPRKPAAKKAPAKRRAPKKAAPEATADDELTIVDVEPEAPREPPPLVPPEDLPEGMDPRDGQQVTPDAALVGTVIDPPWEAYQLLLRGKSWYEIAQQTGYHTGVDAQRAVEALMTRAAAEQGSYNRSIALRLSVARHEHFLSQWWDLGTVKHDTGAGRLVLMALKELDDIQRVGQIDAQAGQHGPRIVIAGTEEDYIKGLQALFAQQNQPKELLPPARGETIDG